MTINKNKIIHIKVHRAIKEAVLNNRTAVIIALGAIFALLLAVYMVYSEITNWDSEMPEIDDSEYFIEY